MSEPKLEHHIFDSPEGLVAFLRTASEELKLTDERKADIVKHEKAHYDKARELGYPASFEVYTLGSSIRIMTRTDMDIFISEFTRALHSRAIMLAPEKPSTDDLNDAKKMEEILNRYGYMGEEKW